MIIRFEALGPNAYILSYGWQMILLIALQFLCFTAFGMYRAVLRYSSLDLARAAAEAVGTSTVTLIAITYFSGNWALSRSVLIINAMLLLIVVVAGRLLLRKWVRSRVSQRKRRSHWKKAAANRHLWSWLRWSPVTISTRAPFSLSSGCLCRR